MTEPSPWWPFGPWFDLAAPQRLTQSILPDWALQRVEVNFAGNAAIEQEVVAKVASYGKQLGVITEAVLALAGDGPDGRDAKLARLRALADEIEAVKHDHRRDLAEDARRAMHSLAARDRAAAERIAAEFGRTPASAAA